MHGRCNAARGETLLQVDGRPRRLCVTLGALAELETHFGVRSFADLGARLANLSASDLLPVISVLCAGGGEEIAAEELKAARIDPVAAAASVARAFQLAFGDDS